MKESTDGKFNNACILGYVGASCLYLVIGILGYATYGNKVNNLILFKIKLTG